MREPTGCHFDWGGLLTEFVLLGNIAIRTGKCLTYDAEILRIPNDAAAWDRHGDRPRFRYGSGPQSDH